MTRHICNDDSKSALSQAASAFIENLRSAPPGHVVLALPGGRTTAPFLHAVTTQLSAGERELFSRLQIFIIDERLVPLTHADSNFRLVRESCAALFHEKLLNENQLHPFPTEGIDETEAIERYCQELQRFGGKFHISVVSAGEDGHIAGLFPNHPGLLAAGDFTTFHDSPKPPSHRMSATASLIRRSDSCFLFFMGEGKRQAFTAFNDNSLTEESCPAKLVRIVPKLFVITDLT